MLSSLAGVDAGMNRRILFAAVALALSAQFTSAHAAPVTEFDDFRSICIAAEGNRSMALAAADQAGWMPIPDEMFRKIIGPMALGEADGRVRSSKSGLSFLIVGAKAIGPFPAEACMIATQGADPDALKAQASAFADAPPIPALSVEGRLAFAWRDVGGHREALSESALERMRQPPAGLKAMIVGPMEDDFAALILLMPKTKPGT